MKENYKQIAIKISIIFAVLVIDMITKIVFANVFSERYLNNNFENIDFIKGVISFTYTENIGAAFSMFSGHVLTLILFSIVFIGVFVAVDIWLKEKSLCFVSGVSLIVGGAIGNLIDRIFLGYVRDFISFDILKDFAICNFADCCITIGCVLIGVFFVISLIKDGKEKRLMLNGDQQKDIDNETEDK